MVTQNVLGVKSMLKRSGVKYHICTFQIIMKKHALTRQTSTEIYLISRG